MKRSTNKDEIDWQTEQDDSLDNAYQTYRRLQRKTGSIDCGGIVVMIVCTKFTSSYTER